MTLADLQRDAPFVSHVQVRSWAQGHKKAEIFDVEHSVRAEYLFKHSDHLENLTIQNSTPLTYSILKITLRLFLSIIFQH